MSYSLTDVQTAAFSQTFELYKPVANTSRTGTAKVFNGVYYSLAYDNVPGRVGQTPAVAHSGPIGATDEYMVFTFDVLRLHIDQECDDRWFVRDKDLDQWYAVLGTAQNRHFRASEATYKCARAEAPPESVDLPIIGGLPGG